VFTYSAEPGTKAFHLEETSLSADKENIRKKLLLIKRNIQRLLSNFKGETLEVLIENRRKIRQKRGFYTSANFSTRIMAR
jgi:tRNA A37 methylthiotransferase MiaB